jgi:hypothetical protein
LWRANQDAESRTRQFSVAIADLARTGLDNLPHMRLCCAVTRAERDPRHAQVRVTRAPSVAENAF